MTFRIDTGFSSVPQRYVDEDGEHFRYVDEWQAFATTEEGRRWAFARSESDYEEGSNPDGNPDDWTEIEPIYGSAAWGDNDEYDLACFEADAYNEQRPIW